MKHDSMIASNLERLSNISSPAGQEWSACDILKLIFSEYCDEVQVDSFFNVSGYRKGCGQKPRKIAVMAHVDEIGMMVVSIDKNGFLYFSAVGGIDPSVLLAQEVVIHGKKDIFGVIGAKPPHLLGEEERNKTLDIKNLCIDTGFTCDKIKELVSIGDYITFRPAFASLHNSRVYGKALDNRAGVAALIEAMRMCADEKHEDDIYFIATSQEEFHMAGANKVLYDLCPDIAVILDACHGDIDDEAQEDFFPLGRGPAIGVGPVLDKNLSRFLIDLCKEHAIPFQIDVEHYDTGTEAWTSQVSRDGIPTCLISVPVRYMHTPCETMDLNDLSNTARLVYNFISKFHNIDLNNYFYK